MLGLLVCALCSNLSSNAVLIFVLKKHCAMPLYCTKMFAILKMFENAFYVFDIFALNCCPLTALHASGPKCCEKIILKKYQSLWKAPLAAIFLFLCVRTWTRHKGAIARPTPFSKLTKQVFLRSYDVPHCVESNHTQRRRELVGQAPNLFKPPKNAALKCHPLNPESCLCFRRLLHLFVITFICVWLN